MATLEARLKLVADNPSTCTLPPPYVTSTLVFDAISQHSSLSLEHRNAFATSWTSGLAATAVEKRSALHPDLHSAILAQDKAYWDCIVDAFAASSFATTHRLAPRPDWQPGQVIIVQNWPTLSKDRNNEDADLWAPTNPSHCSRYLEMEGMKNDEVSIFDWTPCRFSNNETGNDPQDGLPPSVLAACDSYAFFRIGVTIQLGGTAAIYSSWCRQRFFAQASARGILLSPIEISLPFTDIDLVTPVLYFATSNEFQAKASAGKIVFQDSLGMIDRPSPLSTLALDDGALNLVHASALASFPYIHAPCIVYTAYGKRLSEADGVWFFCGVSHLAKVERDTGLCLATEQDILLQGGTARFCRRLQQYYVNNAADLAHLLSTLPESMQPSLVTVVERLMRKRASASRAANRLKRQKAKTAKKAADRLDRVRARVARVDKKAADRLKRLRARAEKKAADRLERLRAKVARIDQKAADRLKRLRARADKKAADRLKRLRARADKKAADRLKQTKARVDSLTKGTYCLPPADAIRRRTSTTATLPKTITSLKEDGTPRQVPAKSLWLGKKAVRTYTTAGGATVEGNGYLQSAATKDKWREAAAMAASEGTTADLVFLGESELRTFTTADGETVTSDGWVEAAAKRLKLVRAADLGAQVGDTAENICLILGELRTFTNADGETVTSDGWVEGATRNEKQARAARLAAKLGDTAEAIFLRLEQLRTFVNADGETVHSDGWAEAAAAKEKRRRAEANASVL